MKNLQNIDFTAMSGNGVFISCGLQKSTDNSKNMLLYFESIHGVYHYKVF